MTAGKIFSSIKRKLIESLYFESRRVEYLERLMINQGRLLAETQRHRDTETQGQISTYEFSIFSQFGEDGILQYLTQLLEIRNKTFIEFGVEDFTESNCRFLMMKDNWSGFVIDGNAKNISRLKNSYYFWKYDLNAMCAIIDRENINDLLACSGFDYDLGILSIDLDGIDYFVLSAIKHWRPRILVCEFNPIFGPTRKVSVPYDPGFQRFKHHHSGLYWGVSLSAIYAVAKQLGYELVGTNSAGHNAFFVRKEILIPPLTSITPAIAFKTPTYCDYRERDGNLGFLTFQQCQEIIRGLKVLNIETNEIESF